MKMKLQTIITLIFRQYSIGPWWGGIKNVLSSMMAYVIFLNFILVAPLGYSSAVAPWLKAHGVPMPLIVFMGIIMVGLILIFIIEYKVTIPSHYSFWNQQFWAHDNPMRSKLEDMDKRLKCMEGLLAKLVEKKSTEDNAKIKKSNG